MIINKRFQTCANKFDSYKKHSMEAILKNVSLISCSTMLYYDNFRYQQRYQPKLICNQATSFICPFVCKTVIFIVLKSKLDIRRYICRSQQEAVGLNIFL